MPKTTLTYFHSSYATRKKIWSLKTFLLKDRFRQAEGKWNRCCTPAHSSCAMSCFCSFKTKSSSLSLRCWKSGWSKVSIPCDLADARLKNPCCYSADSDNCTTLIPRTSRQARLANGEETQDHQQKQSLYCTHFCESGWESAWKPGSWSVSWLTG